MAELLICTLKHCAYHLARKFLKMGYLWPCSIRGHSWHLRYFRKKSQNTTSSVPSHFRVIQCTSLKRSYILTLKRLAIVHNSSTYMGLAVFNVVLGDPVSLLDFKDHLCKFTSVAVNVVNQRAKVRGPLVTC